LAAVQRVTYPELLHHYRGSDPCAILAIVWRTLQAADS
jgi:hypothetical protein